VVQVTHDESCCHAHDGKKTMWLQVGEQLLRKKGDGKSIMVSGFMCPCHGPLDMETIEPGANADGYWTNTRMAAHVSCFFFFTFFEGLFSESPNRNRNRRSKRCCLSSRDVILDVLHCFASTNQATMPRWRGTR